MKKQMLKIAGVKSEKEFYKKYPTEEAFMKAHGKAFKKAQIGTFIGGTQDPGFQPISFKEMYDETDYAVTGMTDEMRKAEQLRQAELAAAQKEGSGGGQGLSGIANILKDEELMSSLAGAKKGKKINKAFDGIDLNAFAALKSPNKNPNVLAADADMDALFRKNFEPGATETTSSGAGLAGAANTAGDIIQSIQQIKAEREMRRRAEQMRDVSGLVKQAASITPEETERRYVRPEDITNTGEEFFPIYGVGTNPLARNGKMVGGIPGEIANTFAPNTLYDDLGYEPLNESERYKQFYFGGKMESAQDGFSSRRSGFYNFASDPRSSSASKSLITAIGGESGGGNLGGTIGGTIGSAFGPAGKFVGEAAGQVIGSLIDTNAERTRKAQAATQKNLQSVALQQGMRGGQQQFSSFMKDGGMTSPYNWVSHTWQPQKITTFGEHKLSDLLRSPKDADMLRAGGHLKEYTPPSARAMSTERPNFQMGGELQIHWGGGAEPMSYNPYLPEGGETIMFKGQSHEESDGKGNTGIGITFGDNPVEVERGEPAIKMKDGSGGDSSLVVFGNLKVPKGMLPGADGKNFKRYVEGLSKSENKANNMIRKATTAIDELDVLTPYDQLAFNTLQAQIDGGNAKLKDIAQNKMDASALQTAMNDTIEEYGLETTDKGTIKAKKGAHIPKAQGGKNITGVSALPEVPKGQKSTSVGYGKVTVSDIEEMKKNNPWFDWNKFNFRKEADVKRYQREFNKVAESVGNPVRLEDDGKLGEQTVSSKAQYDTASTTSVPADVPMGKDLSEVVVQAPPKTVIEENKSKGPNWMTYFNQALPFLRPTDIEELDPNQLAGEMFALSANQLEPVRAQLFQPQLSVPFDISLQDQLNENEASFRSQQRLMGYNPAAQSMLNAQKYMANQKVLGEQFRMNQALKNQVYAENRNLLNQSQLQNLGILDKQYERQEAAKSKTKATTQAALNSISAKYAQNRLENRTLQVYENMYNYRFDPRFRAMNMNPLVNFEAMIANASPAQMEEYKKLLEEKGKKTKSEKGKNGSIVKSLKSL
jgi:hypothetical protein